MKNNSYYIWGDRGYKFQSENERVQQMFEPGNMLLEDGDVFYKFCPFRAHGLNKEKSKYQGSTFTLRRCVLFVIFL